MTTRREGLMTREKKPGGPPEQQSIEDRRERFVLRGSAEGVADSVPDVPPPSVDIEEVLRRLEHPGRRRTHRRSEL
jgi:hypothetical protein